MSRMIHQYCGKHGWSNQNLSLLRPRRVRLLSTHAHPHGRKFQSSYRSKSFPTYLYLASFLFITSTTHQLTLQFTWGWKSKQQQTSGDENTIPPPSPSPSAPPLSSTDTTTTITTDENRDKTYHPSINVTTKPLDLTDEQREQLRLLRSYLKDIFAQCSTLEHRSMLAYNNATKNRRWDDEYTMHDVAAIRRGIDPSSIPVHQLHELYEQDRRQQQQSHVDSDDGIQQHEHVHVNQTQKNTSDWPPNIDEISDHTLLRFLLARKNRIDAAAESLAKTMAWRSHYGVDELASLKYTPLHTLLRSLTVADVHNRCDKHGRPIYIDQMPDVNIFNDFISPDEVMASHVWQVEQMMKKLQQTNEQLDTSSPSPPSSVSSLSGEDASMTKTVSSFPPAIDKIVQIHDLKGLTFGHRHLIKHFTNTSQIDATHYPQTAGVIYLINSPHIFTFMYNSLIHPLLPSITASKIKIYGEDYAQHLCGDLGAENVPLELGGQCDCSGVGKGCLPPKVPLTREQYEEYAPAHVKAKGEAHKANDKT